MQDSEIPSTSFLTYQDMLQHELLERKKRNTSYSLRSFAKTIGVSAPYLSQILRSQRKVSFELAHTIGLKLKWNRTQRNLFLDLVRLEKADDPLLRADLLAKIESSDPFMEFKQLSIDRFRLVSNWEHFAIAELINCLGNKTTPSRLASRLNLSQTQVEAALERLIRVGIVTEKKNGTLALTNPFYGIPSVPSQAIRTFHRSHLKKASHALEKQAHHERDFSGITLAVKKSHLPEIKELIRDFMTKINTVCAKQSPSDSVYQLAVQFYRLDQEDHDEK